MPEKLRGKGFAPELMGTLPAGLTARTAEETLIGIFWGYDGAAELGTPPRLYNQIMREVAKMKGNGPAENARLFALVKAAMRYAGFWAWEQKNIEHRARWVWLVRGIGRLGPSVTLVGCRWGLPLQTQRKRMARRRFRPILRGRRRVCSTACRKGLATGLGGMIEENGRSREYLGVHWPFDRRGAVKFGDCEGGLGFDGETQPVLI